MTDTDGTADVTGPARPRTAEEEQRDKLFESDLNEVCLLLDFVSGRPELSFDKMTMPDMDALRSGDLNKTWSSSQIVEEITKIRFPRIPDTEEVRARNASVLLLAKDQLSRLSCPARGQTIAYTAMYVAAEGVKYWGKAKKSEDYDALVRMAQNTFPYLQDHVQRFRTLRLLLIFIGFIALALTALTYWDVERGRLALQRLDQFWHDREATLQAHPDLWNEKLCRWYLPGDEQTMLRPPPPPAGAGADGDKLAPTCSAFWYSEKSREEARADLDRVFLCSDMNWLGLLHTWCWRNFVTGAVPSAPETTPTGSQPEKLASQVNWQSATAILSVFTGNILPMMFGLLGTLIGAFHSIQSKVRDGELAPRDYGMTILGLPMGIVAGFVVGLFLSPSEAPAQGAGGIAGNLTLTASGLGFLAGYGSQTFFSFVDDLLRRIFPNNAAARVSTPSQVVVRSDTRTTGDPGAATAAGQGAAAGARPAAAAGAGHEAAAGAGPEAVAGAV